MARKDRNKELQGLVASIRETNPDNPIKRAQELYNKWNTTCLITTFAAPIVLSLVTQIPDLVIKTNDNVWNQYLKIPVIVVLTIICIVVGVCFHFKASKYQEVCQLIENDKNIQKKEIANLNDRINMLKKERSFFVAFTNLLGQSISRGENSLLELANLLVVHIYNDCKGSFSGSEITVNLYELKNGKIRIIGHQQEEPFHELPFLFNDESLGVDVLSEDIKEFYSVKCIQNKRKDFFVLKSWDEILDAFKLRDGAKEELKESRDACIAAGFTYNQYISNRLNVGRNKPITLLEIITHNDTIIASSDRINNVARNMFKKYMPLVAILWDISKDGLDSSD